MISFTNMFLRSNLYQHGFQHFLRKASSESLADVKNKYRSLVHSIKHGHSEKAIHKQTKINKKLLVRDRLKHLLDPKAPFLEFSLFAGLNMPYGSIPAAGIITGVGTISGRLCLIIANDSTIKGGTIYPITIQKQLRAQEIALQNFLPLVYVVDSGGAFLPLQSEIFADRNHGGRSFYNEAIFNSLNIPQIALVCGSCTAGGAYVPTMCQEAIIVNNIGHIFLGGPPLVYAALGQKISANDLGGAVLHSEISGCVDYFAANEQEGFAKCRKAVQHFPENLPTFNDGPSQKSEMFDEFYDLSKPFDVAKLVGLLSDSVEEVFIFKENYGSSLLTAFSTVLGQSIGFVTQKAEFECYKEDECSKLTHFLEICNSRGFPVVFLHNINKSNLKYSESSAVHHSQVMSALACSDNISKLSILLTTDSEADEVTNWLNCSKAFSPEFIFSWPTAVSSKNATDIETKFAETLNHSSNLRDDGIILPEETKSTIEHCLKIFKNKVKLAHKTESTNPLLRFS